MTLILHVITPSPPRAYLPTATVPPPHRTAATPKPGGGGPVAVVTIDGMSELKIALVHAGARQDVAVTTGTKAWELFKDDDERHRRAGERRR